MLQMANFDLLVHFKLKSWSENTASIFYKIRDQPKGPSADRPCPVSWPFCRNISAVSGTAQAFLFLFWLISKLAVSSVKGKEKLLI